MMNRDIFNVTVLGIHTFAMIEEITEIENPLGDEYTRVFDGESWSRTTGLESCVALAKHIIAYRYGGSARATPTGFGFVANTDGDVVAWVSPNGRAWAVEYWKFNGQEVAEKKIHFSKLGLTPDALSADRYEMCCACGYESF